RNRATLAGNIANASPIADMTVLLLALGAELIIKNDHGSSRTLPLLNTFIGYKKLAINSDERIDAIMIPAKALKISFEKVSKREHLDIATVNSALAVEEARDGTIKQARLAIGGVAPIPLVIEETAAILQGSKPAAERILQAAEHAQAAVSPITDVRGTSEYRKRLVYRLVLAHAIRFWPEREEELLP
ncbi:MAG TPA: FAD binding domain-containing protein, partial [Spirochaetales bacterium]|nr:FAD binding domain-containing protein [Spirochaetales bacterium]